MSKATLTIEGFVARDPELRSANGKNVTSVSVAHTPRRKNQQTGQYEDAGEALWVQASFWEKDAEAIIASVRKGTLVTITGIPEINKYERNGAMDAQIRLLFGTLGVIPRAESNQGGGDRWAQNQPTQQRDEPWSTPGSSNSADAWSAPNADGWADTVNPGAPF